MAGAVHYRCVSACCLCQRDGEVLANGRCGAWGSQAFRIPGILGRRTRPIVFLDVEHCMHLTKLFHLVLAVSFSRKSARLAENGIGSHRDIHAYPATASLDPPFTASAVETSTASRIPSLDMEDGRKLHCWECLHRSLVCDSARPSCRRCASTGVECPGYGPVKPTRLRWVTPGRVTSRPKRLKRKHAGKGPGGNTEGGSKQLALVRPCPVPVLWPDADPNVSALFEAAEYCK